MGNVLIRPNCITYWVGGGEIGLVSHDNGGCKKKKSMLDTSSRHCTNFAIVVFLFNWLDISLYISILLMGPHGYGFVAWTSNVLLLLLAFFYLFLFTRTSKALHLNSQLSSAVNLGHFPRFQLSPKVWKCNYETGRKNGRWRL